MKNESKSFPDVDWGFLERRACGGHPRVCIVDAREPLSALLMRAWAQGFLDGAALRHVAKHGDAIIELAEGHMERHAQ